MSGCDDVWISGGAWIPARTKASVLGNEPSTCRKRVLASKRTGVSTQGSVVAIDPTELECVSRLGLAPFEEDAPLDIIVKKSPAAVEQSSPRAARLRTAWWGRALFPRSPSLCEIWNARKRISWSN